MTNQNKMATYHSPTFFAAREAVLELYKSYQCFVIDIYLAFTLFMGVKMPVLHGQFQADKHFFITNMWQFE